MIDWSTCTAVEQDPELVSGAWVLRGTPVPISALFENLEDGAQVDRFVEWFPGVSLQQTAVVRTISDAASGSYLEVPFPTTD